MKKRLRVLLIVGLSLSLMTGAAFAASLQINHGAVNGAYKIGYETLGADRTIQINSGALTGWSAANNVGMAFIMGQNIAAGSLLSISFSGVNFFPETYTVCAQNTANAAADRKVGSITFSSATNSANIAIDTSVTSANFAATNFLAVVSGSSCLPATATNALNLSVPATTSTTAPTVTAYLRVGGETYDTASAVNVATIMNQYSYGTAGANNATIDYLTGAKNGSQFSSSMTSANSPAAANFESAIVNYGTANASLSVAGLLTLTDSQNWQGVRRVFLGKNTSTECNLADNVAANTSPASGAMNLSINAANINNDITTTDSNYFPLCVDVTGNVALNQRVIKGTPDFVITGTGAQDISAGTEATLQTWNVDAFQAIMPYANTDNTGAYKVYCILNNVDSAANSTVYVDVMSSTSSNTPTNAYAGTLPAKGTKRIDLDNYIRPWSTGSSEVAEDPVSVGLSGTQRYAVKFTVTSNPENIHITCFQQEGSIKRALPLLKLHNFSAGYQGWIQ